MSGITMSSRKLHTASLALIFKNQNLFSFIFVLLCFFVFVFNLHHTAAGWLGVLAIGALLCIIDKRREWRKNVTITGWQGGGAKHPFVFIENITTKGGWWNWGFFCRLVLTFLLLFYSLWFRFVKLFKLTWSTNSPWVLSVFFSEGGGGQCQYVVMNCFSFFYTHLILFFFFFSCF